MGAPVTGYLADGWAPILGPCRCQGCGEPLWYAKRNSRRLGIVYPKLAWREDDGTIHRCPELRASLTVTLALSDNRRVGSSDETNRIANGARVSATTRGAGVVLPHEVVAR